MLHFKLRQFTYLECVECCSFHSMDYTLGIYICEECYREIHYDNKLNILFSKYKFGAYIKRVSERKAKKLIDLYMSYNCIINNPELINFYYNDMLTTRNNFKLFSVHTKDVNK